MFIGATFREKLVSHRQAVKMNCWIRLTLSKGYFSRKWNLLCQIKFIPWWKVYFWKIILFCATNVARWRVSSDYIYLWWYKFFLFIAVIDEEKPSIIIKPLKDSKSPELVVINIDARTGQFRMTFDDSIKGLYFCKIHVHVFRLVTFSSNF